MVGICSATVSIAASFRHPLPKTINYMCMCVVSICIRMTSFTEQVRAYSCLESEPTYITNTVLPSAKIGLNGLHVSLTRHLVLVSVLLLDDWFIGKGNVLTRWDPA